MFTFPYMWDKRCSMATSLFNDFKPVVPAGDFTGDKSTKCWSIPESLLALAFFSLGVYFMLSVYLLILHILEHMYALHFIVFHILPLYWICFLLGGCYYEVKGPIPPPYLKLYLEGNLEAVSERHQRWVYI